MLNLLLTPRCLEGSCINLQSTDLCLLQEAIERIVGCGCPIIMESDSDNMSFPSFHLEDGERVTLPSIQHRTMASPCSMQVVYQLEQLAPLKRDLQYIP